MSGQIDGHTPHQYTIFTVEVGPSPCVPSGNASTKLAMNVHESCATGLHLSITRAMCWSSRGTGNLVEQTIQDIALMRWLRLGAKAGAPPSLYLLGMALFTIDLQRKQLQPASDARNV